MAGGAGGVSLSGDMMLRDAGEFTSPLNLRLEGFFDCCKISEGLRPVGLAAWFPEPTGFLAGTAGGVVLMYSGPLGAAGAAAGATGSATGTSLKARLSA